LGAGGGTRKRSGCHCASKRFLKRRAVVQHRNKCASERVTCARGIDRTDTRGRNAQHGRVSSRERAVLAQGHDYRQTTHCARRGERKLTWRRWPTKGRRQRSGFELIDD
jgi:hypothetical protein